MSSLSTASSRFSPRTRLAVLAAVAVACLAVFEWRNAQLEAPPLDGRLLGYTPADVTSVLEALPPHHERLYVVTELTADLVFPFVYAALMLMAIRALFPHPSFFRRFAFISAGADLAENAALVSLVIGGVPVSPAIASMAALFTMTKWLATIVGVAGVSGGLIRRWTAPRAVADGAWVPGIAGVVEKELEYVSRRRRHARGGAVDPRDTLIGLALSGGGIRSATTCLGILQAMSRMRILPLVDHLCTVSGGGYIGSCLSSLLTLPKGRGGPPIFSTEWGSFPFNPDHREGRSETDHLRTHGSFLVTRTGLLARETLRSIGHLVSGLLYHLSIAILALAVLTLLYMALVLTAAPDLHDTLKVPTSLQYRDNDPAYEKSRPAESERNVYRLPSLGERLTHKYGLLKQAAAAAGTSASGRRAVLGAATYGAALSLATFLYLLSAYRRAGRPIPGESECDARERALLRRVGFGGLAVTFLLAAWAWRLCPKAGGILWLFMPAAAFATALVASFGLHLLLPRLDLFQAWNRRIRSLWGAYQAMTWYASLAALVLALFPLAAYAFRDHTATIGTSSLVSLVVARLVTSRMEPGAGRWAVPAGLRRFVLGIAVGLGVLLALVAISSSILPANESSVSSRQVVLRFVTAALAGTSAFLLLGWLVDANRVSPHYFYLDRLGETYLYTESRVPPPGENAGTLATARNDVRLELKDLHGREPAPGDKTYETRAGTAPYHLLSTAINLASSRDLTRKDRKSGYFLFSKYFCGSVHTGFLCTNKYQGGRTRLARAMTISGAAASSGIGAGTFFAQAFATVLFNLRLGYWMPNPMSPISRRNGDRWFFWPRWLAREMFMRTNERAALVNLSDGGHTGDNVGIYPLLQRRCRVIIACDAECDPRLSFNSISEALRHAYIDLGIEVDIDFTMIRPDPATGMSRSHCAVGLIRYPPSSQFGRQDELPDMGANVPPGEPLVGYLVYLKNSLTGDEPEPVLNYKSASPEFPHESTVDQFFDDAQFESYRALGVHIAEQSFGAWIESPEFEALRAAYWPFRQPAPEQVRAPAPVAAASEGAAV